MGEYTSIRDTTHSYEISAILYTRLADKSEPVIIGNNVWIGRGCIVLPGSVIDDGVVVGAHKVVKGHLQAYCMYAGAPARLIKNLMQENTRVLMIPVTTPFNEDQSGKVVYTNT